MWPWVIAIILGVLASAAIGAALSIWREYDEPLGGAMMSVLLGPIGWLMILFGEDQRPVCPECGGRARPGFKRCRHCGELLPTPSKLKPPGP